MVHGQVRLVLTVNRYRVFITFSEGEYHSSTRNLHDNMVGDLNSVNPSECALKKYRPRRSRYAQ